MEPASLIVAALVLGASHGLKAAASHSVKDAYAGLKMLLASRLGKRPASLDSLEEKPASKAKQAAVAEDVDGLSHDPEVLAAAHRLFAAARPDNAGAGEALGLDLERIAAAFLAVGDITSEATAARLRDVTLSGGIKMGNLNAGKKGGGKDPT